MIGLDTNILVRILVADDARQTDEAVAFIRRRCSPASPGFVSCLVLLELFWVLETFYAYRKLDILQAMDSLFGNRDLAIEDTPEVRAALEAYRVTNCDFADALIGEVNRSRGCEVTVTFDRKAAKLKGFAAVR